MARRCSSGCTSRAWLLFRAVLPTWWHPRCGDDYSLDQILVVVQKLCTAQQACTRSAKADPPAEVSITQGADARAGAARQIPGRRLRSPKGAGVRAKAARQTPGRRLRLPRAFARPPASPARHHHSTRAKPLKNPPAYPSSFAASALPYAQLHESGNVATLHCQLLDAGGVECVPPRECGRGGEAF